MIVSTFRELSELPFYAGRVTYHVPPIRPDAPAFLECGEIRHAARLRSGAAVLATWLWPPFRAPVDAGQEPLQLDLVVAGSLRNFYGPFHLEGEDDVDCLGPDAFFLAQRQGFACRLKPAGLLGPVILRRRRPGCAGALA